MKREDVGRREGEGRRENLGEGVETGVEGWKEKSEEERGSVGEERKWKTRHGARCSGCGSLTETKLHSSPFRTEDMFSNSR